MFACMHVCVYIYSYTYSMCIYKTQTSPESPRNHLETPSGPSKMYKTSKLSQPRNTKGQINNTCAPPQQLVAVLEDSPRGGTDSPGESISNGYASSAPSPAPSPEPMSYFPHLEYREPIRGEIEVNEDVLKASRLSFAPPPPPLSLLLLSSARLDRCSDAKQETSINTLQLVSFFPFFFTWQTCESLLKVCVMLM